MDEQKTLKRTIRSLKETIRLQNMEINVLEIIHYELLKSSVDIINGKF